MGDRKEKEEKRDKEEKKSRSKTPSTSKASGSGSKATKESLLLAARMSKPPTPHLTRPPPTPDMGKPQTPGFEARSPSNETLSPAVPTPKVSGVSPVLAPSPKKPDVVGAILGAMDVQHSQTMEMFGKFFSSMGKYMETDAKGLPPIPKKRKKSPSPHRSDLTEEAAEDYPADDIEPEDDDSAEEEEEEGGSSLMDHFTKGEGGYVPDDRQLAMWMASLKLDPAYGKDAWSKIKTRSLLKKWTANPAASPFTAPQAESGLPNLKFQDHKNFEKEFSRLQDAAVTIGLIATHLMVLMEGRSFLDINVLSLI